MNDLMPSTHDVVAPTGAIEWTPSRGFVDDPEDLFEARGEGDITLAVTDGTVRDVEGDAPLAVAVRQDSQLFELQRQIAGLRQRLSVVLLALQGASGALAVTRNE